MSLSRAFASAVIGIDARLIEIEVDLSRGLPAVIVVGLPDTAIKESKDRIRTAIKNSNFEYPGGRITINLAPANIKKEGPRFDLAIALALLTAGNRIQQTELDKYIILGELALNGEVRPIKGTLVTALSCARNKKGIIIPYANRAEARAVKGVSCYPVRNLIEAVGILDNTLDIKKLQNNDYPKKPTKESFIDDFSDIKGQYQAKRALEIAASGGHNLIMVGPPGCGKTMLARAFSSITPELEFDEALEVTKIYSVMGLLGEGEGLMNKRPYRAPHHTSSDIALVGGGAIPRPGEVTLSHNGILFLDELPEFHRNVLEVLRQPLEEGRVRISRASESVIFPARFSLIAAMNPCPCGYYTDRLRMCQCTPQKIQNYIGKISGPLLDRIDIHIELARLKHKELTTETAQESSAEIKERVLLARKIQKNRFKKEKVFSNAQMNKKLLKKFCGLTNEMKNFMRFALQEMGLSARAYDKLIKVSRTIADLAGDEEIKEIHLAEALQYRALDREIWG